MAPVTNSQSAWVQRDGVREEVESARGLKSLKTLELESTLNRERSDWGVSSAAAVNELNCALYTFMDDLTLEKVIILDENVTWNCLNYEIFF